MTFPIDPLLPDVRRAFQHHRNLVLQAPPGAGKTTRVPPALLGADWLDDKKILLLEPRRLAARAAARFMARALGEGVGASVGYRTRLDSRTGPHTRIEVVTEGVLTRLLQDDPLLEAVGLVIFDEFHERSLQADLGLALCLDTQSALREDLRLLVMSATLDGVAVARLLGEAPVLRSEGRSYPVEVRYRPTRCRFAHERRAFCEEAARAVRAALREETGSVLVFLPGVGEIRLLESMLRPALDDAQIFLAPLHGQLGAREQDQAIQPVPEGKRKVVLATAIAETSLTIEGIRVVVDAGLMRLPRFDPNSALTRLVTVPVSRAAAEQRCGRAGRVEAGICYRLWPEHQHLLPQTSPEILQADLTALTLELTLWGVRDVQQLSWLDRPPPAHVSQASDLLRKLGALDTAASITAHGRAMAQLGAHPRLAHMMVRGEELGYGALACELAALLSERDPMRDARNRDSDMIWRMEWLRASGEALQGDRALHRRIGAAARQWQQQLGCSPPPQDNADLAMTGVLLAFAYPDRIALRRRGVENRFVLSNGHGAAFTEAEPLAAEDTIVAAQVDDQREARIFLAARIHREHLLQYHNSLIHEQTLVSWDERGRCVQARRQQRLGELVLTDEPWSEADPQALQTAMLEGVHRHAPSCLPWNDAARQLQLRIHFLHRLSRHDWPDVSDAILLSTLEDWLLPYLHNMTRLAQLKKLDMGALLLARLPWVKQKQLDELAPTHVTVPSGSRIRLDYSHETPVLAVRLQEMFGLDATPRIAGGRVAVLLHLLSPASRPVQITQDLAAFWQGSYHAVKKELKGRYPKHHWPDDPLGARASSGTKRRGRVP